MNDKATLPNPFPGLRSFRSDEDHLFFGREEQTLALMSRLERNRFIAVVGSSGRGKSSLVRCGLLSRLQGGGMAGAGAHWEIAVMNPGGDPLRHLAEALLEAGLYDRAEESAVPQLLATLGRSQFGLVQAVRQAALPAGTNFLLVVDQFEEIFRYDEAGAAESELANDFIAMLREACAQTEVPIYVVATMRSDFIGDCSRFEGLAEAVNRGEYLIPRLSREQFKSAIEGPIRVAGGRIAPRLLQRLLNDVGEEQDQLPCLQHALMRTWRVWQGRTGVEALDLEDYAQVGKMSQALSLHADEVWQSLATDRQRELGAAMFKALTVEGSEKRGIRRPRRLQALCRILEVEKTELLPVIDAFRQPEVSFLVPPADVELRDATVIDLSHESLMRVWTRLRGWVDEEARSVGTFRRLAESAALWRQGGTGLCRDPELSIARAWLQTNRPNAAWAEQYEGSFDEAMAYLQASTEAAEADEREREERARAAAARQTRRHRFLIAGLATAVVALSIGAVFGIRAQRSATQQAGRADLLLGSRLLDEGNLGDGLAYLVSAGRKDPTNAIIAPRILTTLAAHNFSLPVGSPLALPSAGLSAAYSADGRRIFVQTEDDGLRVIDAIGWKLEREIKFAQKIRRSGVRLAEKNSEVFAVALADNTIVVCDAATGRPRFAPITPPDRFTGRSPDFGLSPDGRWLAAAGNASAWVWDAATGALRATLPHDSTRWTNFTFSPDSRRIVTTQGAGRTQVWTVPDGAPVGQPIENAANRYGTTVRFSGDGRRLLVVQDTGALICDADTGTAIGPSLPLRYSWDVWLTPDGRQMVRISSSTASVLDLATGKPVFPPLVHDGRIYDSKISPDGKILFTNSVDGLFRLWDLQTGKLLAEPTFRQERFAPAAFSPDGKTVAVFSESGATYQMRLGGGPAAPLLFPRDASVAMVNVSMSAPTRLFWLTTKRVRIFDAASGRETDEGYPLPETIPGPASIRSTYGTKAGAGLTLVLRTLPLNQARTWRAWTLGERGVARDVELADVPDDATHFELNPTGQIAATAEGRSGNAKLGIWNLQTGRRVTTIETGSRFDVTTSSFSISPDEKRIAFMTGDAETRLVHVCEVATGKELSVVQISGKASITSFRFTPDGTRLVTGDDWGGVHIWDAVSGQLQRSTQAHRAEVRRIDFSEDGRYYATASADGSVQPWETATGAPAGPLLLQKGSAGKPDFSPDSTRIITQTSSGAARVWDVRSGQPLTELLDHEGANVRIAAYGPDGRFLQTFARGLDGKQTVRLWAAPPDGHGAPTPAWLLRLATVSAGRRLTSEGQIASAADEVAKMESLRREIAALPDGGPYVEWARWFLSDSPTRSIAPGFTITPAEAEKLAKEMAAATGKP